MLKKPLLVLIVLELNLSTKKSLQLIARERRLILRGLILFFQLHLFYLFNKFSNFWLEVVKTTYSNITVS